MWISNRSKICRNGLLDIFYCRRDVESRTVHHFLKSNKCRNKVKMACSTFFAVEMIWKVDLWNIFECYSKRKLWWNDLNVIFMYQNHVESRNVQHYWMSNKFRNDVEMTCLTFCTIRIMLKVKLCNIFWMLNRCRNDVEWALLLSEWYGNSNSTTFLNGQQVSKWFLNVSNWSSRPLSLNLDFKICKFEGIID